MSEDPPLPPFEDPFELDGSAEKSVSDFGALVDLPLGALPLPLPSFSLVFAARSFDLLLSLSCLALFFLDSFPFPSFELPLLLFSILLPLLLL